MDHIYDFTYPDLLSRSKFVIVADEERHRQFDNVISYSIYNPIRPLVEFVAYDRLVDQYVNESREFEKVI